MKNKLLLFLAIISGSLRSQDYPITPVEFTDVRVVDDFWQKRMQTNKDVTIPIAIFQSEKTGRIDNFKAAAGLIEPGHRSRFRFDDSDVYKIIEGVAYSLMVSPDPALEAKIDSVISYIAAAQDDDGYLYTILMNKGFANDQKAARERWTTTHTESHELYCLGHLYEAAVAYYKATGKRQILEVATKSADLVCKTFGWNKFLSYPGHQEIEIGLAKLYRQTGKKEYLNAAKFFLDARGKKEGDEGSFYRQSHLPVVNQREAVGHSVRALYQYSAMVDIAALTGDKQYIDAVHAIWEDIVHTKLYITGGEGPGNGYGEGFGPKYMLNNLGAYNETCAAIANVYFNHRLFLMEGDAKYVDVMEKSLYNNVLSGVSVSGDRFFYPNTLETPVGAQRKEWFGCACCPSNECRFLSSFPGYIYAKRKDQLYVNLYVPSQTEIEMKGNKVALRLSGGMPWSGQNIIQVDPIHSERFTLMLRIPGWAREEASPGNELYSFRYKSDKTYKVLINGKEYPSNNLEKGYLSIERIWTKGDKVEVLLPLEIREVLCNPKVEANRGKVALQYGPLTYCSEGMDFENPSIMNLLVRSVEKMRMQKDNLFGEIMVIEGEAERVNRKQEGGTEVVKTSFKAIPYCFWANRGISPMLVWYAANEESARPFAAESIATKSIIRCSENTPNVEAIRDQLIPTESSDITNLRLNFKLVKKNGMLDPEQKNWLEYIFDKPYEIEKTMFFWTTAANIAVPRTIRLYYLLDGKWVPLETKGQIQLEADQINVIEFSKRQADGIRVEIFPEEGKTAGLHEWIVN